MSETAWARMLAYGGVAQSVRILTRDYGTGAVLKFYAELATHVKAEWMSPQEMNRADWAAFDAVLDRYAEAEKRAEVAAQQEAVG